MKRAGVRADQIKEGMALYFDIAQHRKRPDRTEAANIVLAKAA